MLQQRLTPGSNRNLYALGGEPYRNRLAQALTRTRDERGFPLQMQIHERISGVTTDVCILPE